jgi:molybdate transport system regulatory protein
MRAVPEPKKEKKAIVLEPTFRLSFEGKASNIVMDQTDALLLRLISERSSLTEAAKEAGVSYRNAWARIKALETRLSRPLVEMKVGGREGGGAKLTENGVGLLREFRRVRKYLFDALEDREFWEHISYRLSARNRLKAKVTKVQKGTITSEVRMRLLAPSVIISIISNEAVQELGLKENDEVEAVIKATDVIVAKRETRTPFTAI